MWITRCTAGVAVFALGWTPVGAQVQRSGANPNAQLMQQYQQAVTERTQLQSENAKLKKDLEAAAKQLAGAKQQALAAKAGVGREQAALAAAQASSESTAKSLEDYKKRTQELVGRFRETIATLKAVETERTQLQQQLVASKTASDLCAERNYGLYEINKEVLDRYEHQGAFSYMARAEPFTRIKRTQVENLVDDYRQRALELRVQRANKGANTGPGSNASPPPAPVAGASPPPQPAAPGGKQSQAPAPAPQPRTEDSHR